MALISTQQLSVRKIPYLGGYYNSSVVVVRMQVWKATSTNNCTEFSYGHTGDGLNTNFASVGLWGNSTALTVLGSGRVGVNVGTSPAYTLHVGGDIGAGGTITCTGNLTAAGMVSSSSGSINLTGTAQNVFAVTIGIVYLVTFRDSLTNGTSGVYIVIPEDTSFITTLSGNNITLSISAGFLQARSANAETYNGMGWSYIRLM